MIKALCIGGGVDSCAILVYSLFVKDLGISHILFSDTGNEKTSTYLTVKRMQQLATQHDIPFTIVKHPKEDIVQWTTRLGVLPCLPGGSHICSQKFKAEPIQRFVTNAYPNDVIEFLIGIEATEQGRLKRFSQPKGGKFKYRYPLVDMNMTRDDCINLLNKFGFHNIQKSACAICPFAQIDEIISSRHNPKQWNSIKRVEAAFKLTSPVKHQNWIDNGYPLNKANRCPPGMWRVDSWGAGARLFAKRINGRQLSVSEWEEGIDNGTIYEGMK